MREDERFAMKHIATSALFIGILISSGCRMTQDQAERLAYDVRDGAERLKNSTRAEEIVEYAPPGALEYSIRFEVSESLQPPYTGALVVGESGTTYHARFVYVPKPLSIKKRGTSAQIVLRKNGGRIEVTDLR